jgi:hypothetical protein
MPASQAAPDNAARTQTAKRLFPIYLLFSERFALPQPPLADARALKPNSDPAILESMEKWMEALDRKIDAFQLRSVMQGSNVGASELRILVLLERLLGKRHPDSADKEKIDFLLAQLLSIRLSLTGEQIPTLAEVVEVLEPVVGKVNGVDAIPELESLIDELLSAKRLAVVKQKSIIERGRDVKNGLADESLLPQNLVACSRFNFLLRKRCFELMKEEVKLIQSGLMQLADKGALTLDCATAKMSSAEMIPGLLEMCRSWQERPPDNYAHDNPFSQVLALQEIVEEALADAAKEKPAVVPAAPETQVKHVEEPLKPTPDVIQIYAELAQLRREHHRLADKVQQQETDIKGARHSIAGLREEWEHTSEENGKLQALVAELKLEIDTARNVATMTAPPLEHTPAASVAPAKVEADISCVSAEVPPPVSANEPVMTAKAPSMQEIFQSLAQRMEEIRGALVAAKVNVKKEAPSHLKLNHGSIVLTASETQAFLSPSSQADELICRGVAARFLLLEATKDVDKQSSAATVETILAVCEAGASQLHEQAAHLPPEQAERVLESARLLSKTLKGFAKK